MKYLYSVLLLLAATVAFAQDFEAGYYIANDGTKSEGLIKNAEWTNNPTNFVYKADENAIPNSITIKDAAEFSVSGTTYKRFTTSIDRSAANSAEPRWSIETVFLKVLVNGSASLYFYQAGVVEKYFYSASPHTTAEQLLYKEYREGSTRKENNAFRDQLYNLMKDKFTPEDLSKVKYRKWPLTQLFNKYNPELQEVYIPQETTAGFSVKVTPGISLALLNIERTTKGDADFNENFENSLSGPAFRLGFDAEYFLPFKTKRWAVFTDPNVQYFKKDNSYNEVFEGENIHFIYEVKYMFVEVPVGIRHYVPLRNKARLFLDAAFVYSKALGATVTSKYKEASEPTGSQTKFDLDGTTSVAAGIGYSLGKYSIAGRITTERELVNNNNWKANYTSIGIILGYKIL